MTLTVSHMGKKNLDSTEILAYLKKRQGKQTLRGFAKELGISPAYLSDIYRGRRSPGDKVLGRLGMTKTTEHVTKFTFTEAAL